MPSSCLASVSHGNAVAQGLLQMVSNVTHMINGSIAVPPNRTGHVSWEQPIASLSEEEGKLGGLSGSQVLVLVGLAWLFLVFVVLLITSILPCFMGMVKEAVKPPEVSVESDGVSGEGEKQGNWLGNLVAKAVEAYDTKKTLGVDVKIGSISVYASTGEVELNNLVVGSPDGYYSPLLQVSKVLVDLDMSKLFYSLGSEVLVEKTEVEDFTLTIEKTFTTSNLNDFLQFLSSKNENLKTATKVQEQPQEASEKKGYFSSWFSKGAKDEAAGKKTMTLREISLKKIGVKMGFYCLAGSGLSLKAGDLGWKDFDTEMCKNMGTTTVPLDIIPFLVMTLLRTILDNVLGDKITQVVQQGVMDACGDVMDSVTTVNSTLAAGLQEGAAQVGAAATAGADAAMSVGGAVSDQAMSVGGAAVSVGGAAVSQVSSLLTRPET